MKEHLVDMKVHLRHYPNLEQEVFTMKLAATPADLSTSDKVFTWLSNPSNFYNEYRDIVV